LPDVRSGTVHLLIEHGRTVRVPPGTRVSRARNLAERVNWDRRPPRVPTEHAVLDVMSLKVTSDDVAGAFHAMADVVHARRTTAQRLLDALDERRRLSGRVLIRGMLRDLRDGACSVLEREYLHRVERAHGLPTADRQRVSRATGGIALQDVPYPDYRLVVELDGRAFHEGERSDNDAFRDIAVRARERADTVRVTYGLVFRQPCQTARLLAELLHERGWTGTFQPCYRCRRRGDPDLV